MTESHSRSGRVVNFGAFVAARQGRRGDKPEGSAETPEAPYLPGFEERDRALTPRAVEHRRRMLVHLAGTRRS